MCLSINRFVSLQKYWVGRNTYPGGVCGHNCDVIDLTKAEVQKEQPWRCKTTTTPVDRRPWKAAAPLRSTTAKPFPHCRIPAGLLCQRPRPGLVGPPRRVRPFSRTRRLRYDSSGHLFFFFEVRKIMFRQEFNDQWRIFAHVFSVLFIYCYIQFSDWFTDRGRFGRLIAWSDRSADRLIDWLISQLRSY